MTAGDTGDRTPGGSADISTRSGPAAALMPALTVTISLLGLCLLWTWRRMPGRAVPFWVRKRFGRYC
ncbi:MAG: hypothetical protein EOQ70_10240 [Mesorhizobium sp.]|nr:MAG: hypothetical protein EOQ70_10240 [Mesorhizobium sp.]RWK19099.1 MAG: hypothetical protein EOR41_11900 [Mesorhizobium sp.]